MKTRYRALPRHQKQFDLHQTAAILRYREWDAAMTAQHGPLYFRALKFPVH